MYKCDLFFTTTFPFKVKECGKYMYYSFEHDTYSIIFEVHLTAIHLIFKDFRFNLEIYFHRGSRKISIQSTVNALHVKITFWYSDTTLHISLEEMMEKVKKFQANFPTHQFCPWCLMGTLLNFGYFCTISHIEMDPDFYLLIYEGLYAREKGYLHSRATVKQFRPCAKRHVDIDNLLTIK